MNNPSLKILTDFIMNKFFRIKIFKAMKFKTFF